MMIEADVSIGPNGEPIMAHPPATTSDLSLQQFLDIVIAVSKQVENFFDDFISILGDRKRNQKGHKVGL